jgi:hypothetical protein
VLQSQTSNPTIDIDNTSYSEVDGAMYYNSSSDSFVCGENGNWVACTGQVFSQTGAISSLISSTSADQTFNYTTGGAIDYTPPTNDCQPGVQYLIYASGTYNQEGSNDGFYLNLYSGTTEVEKTAIAGSELANNSTNGEWNYTATITCWSTTSVTHSASATTALTGTAAAGPAFTSNQYDTWAGNNPMTGVPGTNWTNGGAIALESHLGGATTTHLWMNQFSVQRVGP